MDFLFRAGGSEGPRPALKAAKEEAEKEYTEKTKQAEAAEEKANEQDGIIKKAENDKEKAEKNADKLEKEAKAATEKAAKKGNKIVIAKATKGMLLEFHQNLNQSK